MLNKNNYNFYLNLFILILNLLEKIGIYFKKTKIAGKKIGIIKTFIFLELKYGLSKYNKAQKILDN